jgi:hypothetical protein
MIAKANDNHTTPKKLIGVAFTFQENHHHSLTDGIHHSYSVSWWIEHISCVSKTQLPYDISQLLQATKKK